MASILYVSMSFLRAALRTQIQLQLNYGTNYITMMSDAHGIGSGGTGEIQQTGSSPSTSCLNTVSENVTSQDFSFSVAGVAEQCNSGFQVSWNADSSLDPVNFTVLPLDQGFFPFDVRVDNSATYINSWTMNLTEGTRFSVMMKWVSSSSASTWRKPWRAPLKVAIGKDMAAEELQGSTKWTRPTIPHA